MKRTLVCVLLTALSAAGIGVVTASPAMAYTCKSWNEVHLDDGSAEGTVHVGRRCSDGYSHVWGWVKDKKCGDGRSGEMWIRFWNGGAGKPPYRNEFATASGGCKASAKRFNYKSDNSNPTIYAKVYAGNRGPTQSRGDGAYV